MELKELENIWREYDKKITDNTRLNKEILKRMLIAKPEKRLNWIKIRTGINLLTPVILPLLIAITDVHFQITIYFYIGLSLFMTSFLISYIWDIRYYILIRKLNFTRNILSIKKGIAEMERDKIKATRIRSMIMPFAIFGFLLMLIQESLFTEKSIVMIVLIIVVFISSTYYTFKYSIHERFIRLNREIEEIEALEKD